MKNLIALLSISLFLFACGQEEVEKGPKDEFKDKISEQEARVTEQQAKVAQQETKVIELSKGIANAKETDLAKIELVNVLLDYYREYPKDEYSANCLSKVHMLYTGMGDTKVAIAYADTIIANYPEFADRAQVIESQIVAYEISVAPRNIEMITKYLNLWLEENKGASKEKISEMKDHLEHVKTPLLERLQ